MPGFKLVASPPRTKILERKALRVPKSRKRRGLTPNARAFQQEPKKLLNTAVQATLLVAPLIYGNVLADVAQVDNVGSRPLGQRAQS